MKLDGSNSRGFSKVDLVVTLICVVLLCGLLWKFLRPAKQKYAGHDRTRYCLGNLSGLHKAVASWGMDPVDPWRPPLPPTNMHSALANMGIAPYMFICPKADGMVNRSIGISPATNTANITSTNCNYNYWTLRTDADGDKVLICDRNGLGNASNAVGSWGGNHNGEGGNYVNVAGAGKWVGTNEILAMPGATFDLSRGTNGVGVVTNN